MTWFEDLTPCHYFDFRDDHPLASERLRAVGWLAIEKSFSQGMTPAPVIERLAELLESPVQPFVAGGSHACELCREVTFGTRETSIAGRLVRGGHANLFVPAARGEFTFVAPSLVAHYVIDHGYLLPEVFQEAVLSCPEMGSSRYFLAVLERGPRGSLWREAMVWAAARRIDEGKRWHEGHVALLITEAHDLLARSLTRVPDRAATFSVVSAATVLAAAGVLARSSRPLIQDALTLLADDEAARLKLRDALAAIDTAS